MTDFATHLADVFRLLGPVRVRRMFGGYGVYLDGLMFALVAYDVLYLKVDAQTRPVFEARGCGPFVYEGKGGAKPVTMSYHRAPDEVMERPEEARAWGRMAVEAALRSRKPARASGVGKARAHPAIGTRATARKPRR